MMRYKYRISTDENQKDVENFLKMDYSFPLLNFALVVADVLAEKSDLSLQGGLRKEEEISKELANVEQYKKTIQLQTKDVAEKYIIPKYPRIIQKEIRAKVDSDGIRSLAPILVILENRIEELKDELKNQKELEKVPIAIRESLPLALHIGKKSELSYTNQISFLWASVLRDKGPKSVWRKVNKISIKSNSIKPKESQGINRKIHWLIISDLIEWFRVHLCEEYYQRNIKQIARDKWSGQIDSLKRFYRRKIREGNELLLKSSSLMTYFPEWGGIQHNPNLFAQDADGLRRLFPVVEIKFYPEKMLTVFQMDNVIKARETFFQEDDPKSIIRDYERNEKETSKPLLCVE